MANQVPLRAEVAMARTPLVFRSRPVASSVRSLWVKVAPGMSCQTPLSSMYWSLLSLKVSSLLPGLPTSNRTELMSIGRLYCTPTYSPTAMLLGVWKIAAVVVSPSRIASNPPVGVSARLVMIRSMRTVGSMRLLAASETWVINALVNGTMNMPPAMAVS